MWSIWRAALEYCRHIFRKMTLSSLLLLGYAVGENTSLIVCGIPERHSPALSMATCFDSDSIAKLLYSSCFSSGYSRTVSLEEIRVWFGCTLFLECWGRCTRCSIIRRQTSSTFIQYLPSTSFWGTACRSRAQPFLLPLNGFFLCKFLCLLLELLEAFGICGILWQWIPQLYVVYEKHLPLFLPLFPRCQGT